MNINAAGRGFSFQNMSKTNSAMKTLKDIGVVFQNEGNIGEKPAVKLSISGLEKQKNAAQLRELCSESPGFQAKEVVPLVLTTDYLYMFQKSIPEDASWEDAASSVFERYAEQYDEIVQGYASGERELYIQDSESEKGYRRLTQAEELGYLNHAYERIVNMIDVQARREPGFVAKLESYGESLWQEGKLRKNEAMLEYANKIKEQAARQKQQLPAENIRQKMIEASREFIRQYMNGKSGIHIRDLIENIKVFE